MKGQLSPPGWSLYDIWWAKWHWGCFFSYICFDFLLSIIILSVLQIIFFKFWWAILDVSNSSAYKSQMAGSFVNDELWYDIFINCNCVVTRWQYIFTHKQYVEQHK